MKAVEETAISFFEECREKTNHNGMFCVLSKDGDVLYRQFKGQCHAGLNFSIYTKVGKRFSVATLGHHMKDWNRPNYDGIVMQLIEDDTAVRAYYDWLINRCIFSGWFLTPTSVDFALEHGFIISCEAPSNVLAWLCMATRWPRENYRAVRLWHTLSTVYGLHEDLAYVVAFSSYEENGFKYIKSNEKHHSIEPEEELQRRTQLTSGFSGHHNLHPLLTMAGVKNFIDRKPHNLNKPYSTTTVYVGVDNLFVSNERIPWQNALGEKYSEKIQNKSEIVDNSVPNPFKTISHSDVLKKNTITWKQFLFEGGKELLTDIISGKESIIDTQSSN